MGAATAGPVGGFGGSAEGAAMSSGLGDLTRGEVGAIQGVVNKAGRPLNVVGSAANGTRRGFGSNLPIGKGFGTQSDIDYLVGHSSAPYFEGLQTGLPSNTGIIGGNPNPFMGPSIQFVPRGRPPFN